MSKTKPTHDAVYRSGSFTGRDGKERNAYGVIGAAWPNDKGELDRIKIDAVPVTWDGIIYLRRREDDAEEGAR